jgi:hypothetical protein
MTVSVAWFMFGVRGLGVRMVWIEWNNCYDLPSPARCGREEKRCSKGEVRGGEGRSWVKWCDFMSLLISLSVPTSYLPKLCHGTAITYRAIHFRFSCDRICWSNYSGWSSTVWILLHINLVFAKQFSTRKINEQVLVSQLPLQPLSESVA